MDLKNCVAVISGGASGLGAACAEYLVDRGGQAAVLDLDADRGQQLAGRLGRRAIFCRTDVTDEQSVQAAIGRTIEAWGAVHAAVNCAGVLGAGRIISSKGRMGAAFFRRVVDINLTGTMNLLTAAAEKMQLNQPNEEGERGVVINTSSGAAYEGQIGQTAYSASKAGVVGLTLPAARELAKFGIRVMAVAPGLFLSPMTEDLPADKLAALERMIPFPPRAGRPPEFAALVGHIITNPLLNGEVIRLDGGLRLGPK